MIVIQFPLCYPSLGNRREVSLRVSHRRALYSFLTTALLFLSTLAHSQTDLPSPAVTEGEENILFQEIPSVYGASKYEQKVTEAPSSVTIITADEIRKYGYRTLADILRSVTGFFVTYDRNYSYVGIRGFNRPGDYNSRVLLLVDGHRLNDNNYDQAGLGTEALVDVDLIDRVEIIRGPSSSLYGTNAFFGVINILMKRGRDIKGVEVSSEVGSYDSYKGRVTYGNRFQNGLEILLSGSFYDSQGHPRLFFKEFKDPTTNNGIVKNGDDDQFPNFFAKLSFRDFALEGNFLSREKGIPTAAFGTVFNTTRTRTIDEHGYIDFKYEHEFSNQLGLMAHTYYDRFYYRGDYLYDYATYGDPASTKASPFLVLNQDVGLGEWWGSEVKLTKKLMERHKLTLGAEYQDNFRQDLKNADTKPFLSYFNSMRSSRNWALYLQDEFTIFDQLLLNAGVRYDYYDSFGGTINPRLGLIYNLRKTSFKLLYGEAFRAPSEYERFYVGTGLKASPNLKPENITTYEFVVAHYLGDHLRGIASSYYYTIDGLISQQLDPTDGLLMYKNLEKIEAKGLELELEGKWASGLEGLISYALQETDNQQTGRTLTNSPQHLVKVNVIVPLIPEKLFVSLQTRYMSERRTLSGKWDASSFTTDLTLFNEHLIKGVEISASIYNLFDETYGDPGSGEHRQDIIEQDGRTFWVKVKYGF